MRYLILGASSGLGRELAYLLAKKNNNLVIISRDERDLKAIKQDRKSTRLNSSHVSESRMPSSA